MDYYQAVEDDDGKSWVELKDGNTVFVSMKSFTLLGEHQNKFKIIETIYNKQPWWKFWIKKTIFGYYLIFNNR